MKRSGFQQAGLFGTTRNETGGPSNGQARLIEVQTNRLALSQVGLFD
jgi:hypothetical protein